MPLLPAAVSCSGKLSNIVREMVTSTALAAASGVKRKQLLVMDEVDGMSGGWQHRGTHFSYSFGCCVLGPHANSCSCLVPCDACVLRYNSN